MAGRLFAELVGFAALLFVTRFVARGHLDPLLDEHCHLGAIAVDLLAHGVRFPLLVYAPAAYNNGAFFSGLLTALAFSLLGRNVLALKLVTHLFGAAGAVATLWLLRSCLDELGLTRRWVRRVSTITLVIALALAPRVVTAVFMASVGIGSSAESSAINTLLLALFAHHFRRRSVGRTLAVWTLVGFSLYLSKGTVLVIPALAVAEIALAWPSGWRLAAALGGFLLGGVPSRLVASQPSNTGWALIFATVQRNAQGFPRLFFSSVWTLAEHRMELVAAWALALSFGVVVLVRFGRRFRSGGWPSGASKEAPGTPLLPVTFFMVVGVSWLHLAVLMLIGRGGLDHYTVYGYPTLVVLFALLVGVLCARATARLGTRAEPWISAVAIGMTLVLYRPDAVTWGFGRVVALWQNRAAAACSWHLAEGFGREYDDGLVPPGRTREQHEIERCRSLSDQAQVLDCIGGMGRELESSIGGKVAGEPPASLSAAERRAYAYYYGIQRVGDMTGCSDFVSPDLRADCAAAVQLECLVFGDYTSRFAFGHGPGRPRCIVPEPPLDGYWAAMRRDLLASATRLGPRDTVTAAVAELGSCQRIFDQCY